MRRFFLAFLMGMLICNLAFGVDIKSQIGKEDINFGTGTFQRRTSTGGTITLNKVDGSAIPDGTIPRAALDWGPGATQIPRYFSSDAFSDNLTLYGKGVTGDNTGNISGFDNAAITGRTTTATLTVTGIPTFTDNTVNGADLIDNTVTSAKILDNSIASSKILDNTIALGKIAHTGTASSSTFLRGDGSWASANQSQMYSFKNLNITTPADSQNVTITADKVVVVDDTDVPRLLTSVSLTVALDTSGANGRDAGSLAANTGYFLYVIYDTTTTAGLASTSATAPAMPSGYTYKALVGWCTTDATGTPFNIEEFTQIDDVYQWGIPQKVINDGASTTTTAMNMAAGGALSYALVPPTITRGVYGKAAPNIASLHLFLNPVTFANSMTTYNDVTQEFYISGASPWTVPALLESQTFYYQINTNNIDMWISGFTLKR